ncbi:MAG TPA: tRNA (adenosine(37)-N6)-threonylcarbamoyltransferase complex dimerization subunit type 1 TsaB [Myxococcales bacterium]|nr:tRNA (adenosine(37)-N6)-threonylcarbamoyltransferase complex dimerization subunit type 1 TsaB [Myxococcales bacterium]
MRVLALDSSSSLLSCALWEDGRAVAETVHAEKAGDVLPEALLDLASLESVDALAAGIGPGSFTGLRVGLSAVKALAFARRLPLAGASSLRALALSARRHSELLVPTLPARRGELYACAVRGDRLVIPETVLRAQDLPAWLPEGAVLLGPGARANGFPVPGEPRSPSAWAVAELCSPLLRSASYSESACFSLSPNYLSPLSAEVALREGRVGKLS